MQYYTLQLQREACPISTHMHWHSTQDIQYAPRVLHFSAFILDIIRELSPVTQTLMGAHHLGRYQRIFYHLMMKILPLKQRLVCSEKDTYIHICYAEINLTMSRLKVHMGSSIMICILALNWCACMHHCTSLKSNFAVHSLMQCFHIFICAMFIELLMYSCLIFLAGNHLSV